MARKWIALALALALLGLSSAAFAEETAEPVMVPDFTLRDQFGAEHSISDYRGRVVLLNFWTTWCGWCVYEMPDMEKLYHELGENGENVAFLGIANPSDADTADEEGVKAFLEENGFTYPCLMDLDGSQFAAFGISAFPTSFLINADGTILGYLPGAMTRDTMIQVLNLALEESGMELIPVETAEEAENDG